MIFPYLYTDMSLKRVFLLSILSASTLLMRAQTPADAIAANDTIRFEDGAWYCGEIADSLFNGYGKMLYPDSTFYEGEWKNGLWEGKGELRYPDGDSYSGQFKQHEFSGYGKYLYADGGSYEGYWENGMFNGPGTMTYSDGSTYSGNWKDDMKDGPGVYYNSSTGSLLKGLFNEDLFIYQNTSEGRNGNNSKANAREDDGKFHYDGLFTLSLTYGMGQILSFHVDYHTSDSFFAGFQLGFNTVSHEIGKVSVTTDDETGEKVTLVGWDWYMDEILTEKTHTAFKISGECGCSLKRFSIGTALGLGLDCTVRNCRSKEENDSYYEPGTLYYRSKITGVRFAYDIFTEYVPNLNLPWFDISLRAGYSNLERFHIGMGVVF